MLLRKAESPERGSTFMTACRSSVRSREKIDHPLFHLENVILTPHSGGCSVEALAEVKREAVQQVLSVLDGTWPANVVNPQVTPRCHLNGR